MSDLRIRVGICLRIGLNDPLRMPLKIRFHKAVGPSHFAKGKSACVYEKEDYA